MIAPVGKDPGPDDSPTLEFGLAFMVVYFVFLTIAVLLVWFLGRIWRSIGG